MSSVICDNIKVSVFGESHGEAIGCVIDGLPAGVKLDMDKIYLDMSRRAPGKDKYATPRLEKDIPHILSGVLNDITTGAPLAMVIQNTNTKSGDYANLMTVPRPSHSDYPAYVKYNGFNDVRGGGHFSGRLTAPIVFAGAVAKQILEQKGVKIGAHIRQIGSVLDDKFDYNDVDESLLDFVLGDEETDKEVFALRPMTCPFQYYVYKAEQHSYRDLPLRYGETSTLFRNEDSGEMHGLTRVRQFTISEGHLIVRPDQMVKEFKDCIALAQYCLQVLGVEEDVTYHLSKWDPNNREKYIGDAEVWNQTEAHIRQMLEELNIPFTEDVGEAAFYGPKVDINAKNVYGKEDTMITIQWDALLAEQFDMYYIDENGEKQRPYIIHRTSMGCYERTLAWLIEKYAGMFPTWLCPEQVRVIPISEKFHDYAAKVEAQLKENGIRCSVDQRSEKMGYKIREARLARVPYMLIVGAKEEEEGKVSVRSRYLGDEGMKDLGDFLAAIKEEIKNKTIRKIEVQEENK